MKVFISHSSQDNRFVTTLKDDLIENGIETWVDLDTIRPGDYLTDKLERALEEMTHFIIVLSPSSVKSEWVKLELEQAINNKGDIFQKVIPIKYRECTIPEQLENIVYGDLSTAVVKRDGDRIKFFGDSYDQFLKKLVEAIKRQEKLLTADDKAEIEHGILAGSSEEFQQDIKLQKKITIRYKLVGYKVTYKDKMRQRVSNALKISATETKPVLLPPMLFHVFGDLSFGDELNFTYNFLNNAKGHFAGFRKDDLKITLPKEVRRALRIENLKVYIAEIDVPNKTINFSDE